MSRVSVPPIWRTAAEPLGWTKIQGTKSLICLIIKMPSPNEIRRPLQFQVLFLKVDPCIIQIYRREESEPRCLDRTDKKAGTKQVESREMFRLYWLGLVIKAEVPIESIFMQRKVYEGFKKVFLSEASMQLPYGVIFQHQWPDPKLQLWDQFVPRIFPLAEHLLVLVLQQSGST